MNSNGIAIFEIEGVEHTLYFGMKANRIFQEKSIAKIAQLNEGVTDKNDFKNIDPTLLFTYAVYAGMCNNAERREQQYPEYHDAYDLTEKILMHEDQSIQVKIWEVFEQSKANEALLSLLNTANNVAPEVEKKKKTKKSTGTR